jgi:WD40 repeat protein
MSSTSQILVNPYIGPRAFQRGERIYGRDREASQLTNLFIAERIVLLHSPSGAGKTSLIQAALIPQLQKMKFHLLPVVRVNLDPAGYLPGSTDEVGSPNRYVFSTLLSLEEDLPPEGRTPADRLAKMSLPEYLGQRPIPEGLRDIRVLIFDQFEELLTLDPTDQSLKREYFQQLGEAMEVPNLWALFAMRDDFVASLEPYLLPIPNRFRSRFRLDLLGKEAALQAIQEPARAAGVQFEDAAAARLVDDLRRVQVQQPDGSLNAVLGPYIEPVQLQVVCFRMWAAPRQVMQRITEADLAGFGQVDQSLVDASLAEYYAQQAAAAASETGVQERAVREWFDRRLITEGGLRGTVLMEAKRSGGLENPAIWEMVDAHLVRAEKRGGATWFELTHDRLVAPVRADNAAWFERHLTLFQRQADLWDRQGRPDGLLLGEADIAQAERWAAENSAGLLPSEVDFLAASREEHKRVLRLKRRNQVIAALGVIATLLAVLALVAFANSKRNEETALRQARIARSGQLAAQSQAALDQYPQLSLLLAVEALNVTSAAGEPRQAAAEEALRASLKSPHGVPLFTEHSAIWALEYSPDGRWLASGSEDGTVWLWDLSAEDPNAQALSLLGHQGRINTLGFSPDGRWLATGGEDDTVRLWDLESSDPASAPLILEAGDSQVLSLAFSPDGRRLAGGLVDGMVWVWALDLANPAETPRTLPSQGGWVQTLAFSPDGRWLAAGESQSAWLWDMEADDPAADPLELPGHEMQVQALAFSPDGRWLATGSQDTTAYLWDMKSDDPARDPLVLSGHSDWVNALGFSPDGRWLATGSRDWTARLWDLSLPDPTEGSLVLPGHRSTVRTLDFSPDGRWLATGSNDHAAFLWDLDSSALATDPVELRGHDDAVNVLAFNPHGLQLATGGEDASVRLWNLAETDPAVNPLKLSVAESEVLAMGFNPNSSRLFRSGDDNDIISWDITAIDPNADPEVLDGHQAWVETLVVSPDGRWLATGGGDGSVRLWELDGSGYAAGSLVLGELGGEVKSLAFSPLDGRWLAVGGEDDAAWLWDLGTSDSSTDPLVLTGHDGEIHSLAFSPDGRWLATGSADNTARLWDLESADLQAEPIVLEGHADDIFSVAFSPDGRWLATGSGDRTARLWDIESSDPASDPLVLEGHQDQVLVLAFSPDGKWLATSGFDGTARLWDMESSDLASDPTVLPGHQDWVTTLAFSPDGRWLATGSDDRTVQLWDMSLTDPAAPGVNPVVLDDHEDRVTTLAFSPDGRWLATGSADWNTRLYLLRLEELKEIACRSAGRNLSETELQQYFPGEDYRPTCPENP